MHGDVAKEAIHRDRSESTFTFPRLPLRVGMEGRATRTTSLRNATRWASASAGRERSHGKAIGAAYVAWLERLAGPTKAELRQNLLQCVQGTNCGKDADAHRRKAVDEAAMALERKIPSKRPTSGPLAGRWRLIYTTETSVHKILALFPVLGIFQTIDLKERRVQNFIQCRGNSSIAAEAPLTIEGPRRLSYFFDVFIFTLLGLSLRLSPGKAPPGGWQDTTYVDEYYKIVRNSQSDLLVLEKVEL